MKLQYSLLVQLKSIWLAIALIVIVSASLICVIVVLHYWKQVPFGVLTRDAASTIDFPIYTGFLSQVGVLCWAGSAAVCLFCVNMVTKNQAGSEIKYFFLVSGLLTLVLGLDDTFLLHEEFFPNLGVPQKLVYVGYIGFVIYYLVRFFSTLLKTEYLLLIMALGFFGSSVAVDVLSDLLHSDHTSQVILGMNEDLLEDSLKLIGIVSWLTYFFRTGTTALCRTIAPH